MFRIGRFELQPDRRRLLLDGEPLAIGARAFDVLLALAERRDRVVSKAELLDLAWPGLVVEENNLQVQISTLRKLLGQAAIATVPGAGYRLTAALSPEPPEARSAAHSRGAESSASSARPEPTAAKPSSIAILPFVNMSDDAANEYFADGIAEELLNVLSRIRGLRVASRTSAFTFKGANLDLSTVAQKLNVATILEGSVRKAGNRVRVTVQLVEAASDSHLWSQTYDRELQDIFGVQEDIARSVVKELRDLLVGTIDDDASARNAVVEEVRSASKGRVGNAEAYRLYLQGRFFVARRKRPDTARGIEYLRQAVELDPGYALAWAELGYAQAIEAATGWASYSAGHEHARESAQRALALEPDLAEGHVVLAMVRTNFDWDWKRGEASRRRALELAPGNLDVLLAAISLFEHSQELDEAIALCRRVVALDPLSVRGRRYLGLFSLFAGHLDQAEAALKDALELDPHGGMTHALLGDVYLAQGRFAEALAAFETESHEGFRPLGLAIAHHALGQEEASALALEHLATFPQHSYLNAKANAYCGNIDVAFDWLERAFAQRNAGLTEMRNEPLLRNLRSDARWLPFLAKMGLAR